MIVEPTFCLAKTYSKSSAVRSTASRPLMIIHFARRRIHACLKQPVVFASGASRRRSLFDQVLGIRLAAMVAYREVEEHQQNQST